MKYTKNDEDLSWGYMPLTHEITFGYGDKRVLITSLGRECMDTLVVTEEKEMLQIGEKKPFENGSTIENIACVLRFKKSASVQVVIDYLTMIRDDLREAEA